MFAIPHTVVIKTLIGGLWFIFHFFLNVRACTPGLFENRSMGDCCRHAYTPLINPRRQVFSKSAIRRLYQWLAISAFIFEFIFLCVTDRRAESAPPRRGGFENEYCVASVEQCSTQTRVASVISASLVNPIFKTGFRPQVVRLLPGWIAERVVKPGNFGQSFVALRRFFAEMHARKGTS